LAADKFVEIFRVMTGEKYNFLSLDYELQ